MDLQSFLVEKFSSWRPAAPAVVSRNKGDITLTWMQDEPFGFLGDQLLYRIEKRNKMPRWLVVYSGGKTTKMIDNLAPRNPHRFRLRAILKSSAVPHFAEFALAHFGDESTVYEAMNCISKMDQDTSDIHNNVKRNNNYEDINTCHETKVNSTDTKVDSDVLSTSEIDGGDQNVPNDEARFCNKDDSGITERSHPCGSIPENKDPQRAGAAVRARAKWLESQWSLETWTSTDTDGSSPVCFCMAVRCGYLKQVQVMLEERPDLMGIMNPTNGFTPLAVAVRKGDINTVKFLLTAGADIEQPSATGQVPLHLAVLAANVPIIELLIDKGADMRVGDCNGLRAEHYAVESRSVAVVRLVLAGGGDVRARDHNGWTPLFRADRIHYAEICQATGVNESVVVKMKKGMLRWFGHIVSIVCQGAETELIEELVSQGSEVDIRDQAGLPLASVARLLTNRYGRSRASVLRLVDSSYPHEKAFENFTRLTKKIYNVHSLLKLG